MAQFAVNIFGTTNDDVDGGIVSPFKKEFILHIIKVTSNIPITNFEMFIEFYAVPWDLVPSGGRVIGINSGFVDGRYVNGRPQVIHIDTMTPIVLPSLQVDCQLFPNGGGNCPNPEDIRLFSMVHAVPVDASPSGYDINETDMEDVDLIIAELPVNILIIADGCRYQSTIGSAIKIYRDYFSSGALFGASTSNPDNKVIGQDEIIVI